MNRYTARSLRPGEPGYDYRRMMADTLQTAIDRLFAQLAPGETLVQVKGGPADTYVYSEESPILNWVKE